MFKGQKKLPLRLFTALIGLMICGVGVGMFLFSGLGVDPASVFQLGLGNVFHISYGTASALSNLIILVIVFIVDKSYISISSLLAIFSIGYTADFMKTIMNVFIKSEPNMMIKILLLTIGCLIMSVGIATYIRADLGVGAIDMVSEVISDKSKIAYRIVRVSCDIAFVVVGFLLGGALGIGTIVAAFLTGPAVQFVRPGVHKIIDKFLAE